MNWTKEIPTGTRSGNLNAWFDSIHYQRLYGHRDHTEAANFIEALIRRLRPRAGASLLDVACGIGRHANYLASKGFRVTGFDLAAEAIRTAKKAERAGLRFFQHDMRIPFGRHRFDYVFNFFTSFGYFESPEEHFAVVRNMANSLTTDGTLVLDYLNVYSAEANLVPHELKRIENFTYYLTRWSDRNSIFKKIVIEPTNCDEPREYVERVAKFTLRDFQQIFERCGLSISEVYGDYSLNRYDMLNSPRLILIARRADTSQLLRSTVDNQVVDSVTTHIV
jgi:SAM-dependent methyltransferase